MYASDMCTFLVRILNINVNFFKTLVVAGNSLIHMNVMWTSCNAAALEENGFPTG